MLARIDAVPPGKRPPLLRAQASRFTALLASVRDDQAAVEQGFKTAESVCREFGLTFHLAVAQLEHGEWLVGRGRPDEAGPMLAEAREILERLRATPWVERIDAAGPRLARIGAEAN